MYLLPRLLTAIATLGCLVACANTDDITGGAPVGGSSGGDVGQGGQAGSMPQSSSTGIGPCDEDPCKLVTPQCGCEEDLACTVNSAGDRLCAIKGNGVQGSPCSDTALCGAGLICVGYGAGLLSCAKFCNDNKECEMPGGKCEVELEGSAGVTLCSENCDLISNQGCALVGTSCQFAIGDNDKAYTLCAPSGDVAVEGDCAATSDCLPGSVCLPNSVGAVLCFQWCDVGAPACPEGFACDPYEIEAGVPLTIGDINYGICNPN